MDSLPKTLDEAVLLARAQTDAFLEWANPDLNQASAITSDWPLARGEDMVLIVIVYLLFVLFGRIAMSCLPPIRLRTLKYLYNPLQVLLCGWMTLEALRQAHATGEGFLGLSFNPQRSSIASVLWVFYISKVLDFFDTAFIILEKDWRRLSFLHVYHHSSIFVMFWMNLRAGFDGDIYLTIVLNGFVHFVMYSYYMITALKLYVPVEAPTDSRAAVVCKPYRPSWKWLVTMTQLFQFVVMNVQAAWLLYFPTPNGFPTRITMIYMVYIQSLFWLFFQFAMENYCGKSKKKTKKN